MNNDVENQCGTINEYIQKAIVGLVCLGAYFISHLITISSVHMAIGFKIPIQNVSIYFTKLYSCRTLFMIFGSLIEFTVFFYSIWKYMSLVSFSLMVISRFALLLVLYFSRHLSFHTYFFLIIEAFFFGHFQISFIKYVPQFDSTIVLSNNLSGFVISITQSIIDFFFYHNNLFNIKIQSFLCITISSISLLLLFYFLFCFDNDFPKSYKDVANEIRTEINNMNIHIEKSNSLIKELINGNNTGNVVSKLNELVSELRKLRDNKIKENINKFKKMEPIKSIDINHAIQLNNKIDCLNLISLMDKLSDQSESVINNISKIEEIEETKLRERSNYIISYIDSNVKTLNNDKLDTNFEGQKNEHKIVERQFPHEKQAYVNEENKLKEIKKHFDSVEEKTMLTFIENILVKADPVREINKLNSIIVRLREKYFRIPRKMDYDRERENLGPQCEAVINKLREVLNNLDKIRTYLKKRLNNLLLIIIGTVNKSENIKTIIQITEQIKGLNEMIGKARSLDISKVSKHNDVYPKRIYHEQLNSKMISCRNKLRELLPLLKSMVDSTSQINVGRNCDTVTREIFIVSEAIKGLISFIYPSDDQKRTYVIKKQLMEHNIKTLEAEIKGLCDVIDNVVSNELKKIQNPIDKINIEDVNSIENEIERNLPKKFIKYYPLLMTISSSIFKDFLNPGLIPYGFFKPADCNLINKIIPIFKLFGTSSSFVLQFFGDNFKYFENYYHYVWIILTPGVFVFFSSLIAIHSNIMCFLFMYNSKVLFSILTMLLFTSSSAIESMCHVGTANYIFYQSGDIRDNSTIMSYYNISKLMCSFILSKISLGYVVTKNRLGYYHPGDYYTKRSFIYWFLNTFKNAFVDMAFDFKLNIRQYI